MSVWKKIVAGEGRKTRLHDELGNIVPASRLLRNGPRALVSLVGRLAFDSRAVLPWISYDAQALIAGFLTKDKRVLEFGSGMSTAWYAARAGQVVSIEDYRPWYDKVTEIFRRQGVDNVAYRFAADRAAYLAPAPEDVSGGFDFVMIDGSYRDACVDVAIAVLRPGGWIYLDNADKGADSGITGNCAAARDTLTAHAAAVGGTATWVTDFSPTQFFVQSGLLIRT